MQGPLTPRLVERWALEAVESFVRGERDEDSRVEFKRQMPDGTQRVARRLGALANAAMGAPILLVLGVGADRTLMPGRLPEDPANYWPRIWSEFDHVHPELVEAPVDFDGTPLLALGFNCEMLPYLVRTGKDAPSLEVPWRAGTGVVTASRSQILRMMLPLAKAPKVEVRNVRSDDSSMAITFFVVPPTSEPLTLPFHRCELECRGKRFHASTLTCGNGKLVQPHPMAVEANEQAVYFKGPAEVVIGWRLDRLAPGTPARCCARLMFEPGEISVIVAEGMPTR